MHADTIERCGDRGLRTLGGVGADALDCALVAHAARAAEEPEHAEVHARRGGAQHGRLLVEGALDDVKVALERLEGGDGGGQRRGALCGGAVRLEATRRVRDRVVGLAQPEAGL